MTLRVMLSTCAATFFILVGAAAGAAPTTDIVPLNYALADSVIPAIEPLLEGDERVSAYGNKVIIRAEPARIKQIRALLADLDHQPGKLRITVRNTGSAGAEQSGYRLDGRVKTQAGDIVVGHPRRHNQARVTRRDTQDANDGTHVIMANEGYPVLIQTGQRVPLTSTSTNIYGQVLQQTDYHDVTAGFYATVRINGDVATMDISANNDRMQQRGDQAIDVQRTDTVVTARLGEWVTIGGLDDNANSTDRDIGRRTTTRSHQQHRVQVKIEQLD